MCSAIVSIVILDEAGRGDYLIMFYVSAALMFVSFCLQFFLKVEDFDYEHYTEQVDEDFERSLRTIR
jgi:ABC-type sulfate transport system permease component